MGIEYAIMGGISAGIGLTVIFIIVNSATSYVLPEGQTMSEWANAQLGGNGNGNGGVQ